MLWGPVSCPAPCRLTTDWNRQSVNLVLNFSRVLSTLWGGTDHYPCSPDVGKTGSASPERRPVAHIAMTLVLTGGSHLHASTLHWQRTSFSCKVEQHSSSITAVCECDPRCSHHEPTWTLRAILLVETRHACSFAAERCPLTDRVGTFSRLLLTFDKTFRGIAPRQGESYVHYHSITLLEATPCRRVSRIL